MQTIDYSADVPRLLPEFKLYRPRAGHPDWPRLAAEAREYADRLRPQLERPQSSVTTLKRRLRSVRSAAENWVINRKLSKQGREDLLPFVLLWTPALARAARDMNHYPIIVNTNGSILHKLLEKPNWRTWLADMDQIIVSLDSLDLAALKTMWVCKKPQDVIRNLLILRELSEEMNFRSLSANEPVTRLLGRSASIVDCSMERS